MTDAPTVLQPGEGRSFPLGVDPVVVKLEPGASTARSR